MSQLSNIPEENKELILVAPFLASLDKVNVFSLPDTYFENLQSTIKYHASILQHDNKSGFETPENYFNDLNEIIKNRISIALISNESNTTNEVPEGYFNSMETFLPAISYLESIKDKNTFVVPDYYFETAKTSIISETRINNFNNKSTFATPENYFELLEQNILSATSNKTEKDAVVISIKRVVYAVAASVALILGAYGLLKNNNEVVSGKALSKIEIKTIETGSLLAYVQNDVDEATLIDYLSNNENPIETEIQKSEVIEYLLDENIDMNNVVEELNNEEQGS